MKKNNYARRMTVLNRLEAQLEAGTKNSDETQISLTEKDKTRITKEVGVLNARLKSA